MPPRPIPTLEAFRKATKNRKLLQRARGSNISRVDSALKAYWQEPNAFAHRRVRLLAGIVSACSRWLKLKNDNRDAELVNRRRQHIAALAQAALDHILLHVDQDPRLQAMVQFDRRKINALKRPRGPAVPLRGVYGHERSLYLKSGKSSAPSATLFHGYLQGAKAYYDDRNMLQFATNPEQYTRVFSFMERSFEDLTEGDFRKLEAISRDVGRSFEVQYLKKEGRMKYWAAANPKGLLVYQVSKALVHAPQSDKFTWAMDMYGNLFLARGEQRKQFNHSSYNAGKDVLAAGGIQVQHGLITFIDNSSGHYKPSKDNLVAALRILQEDGVRLSDARVEVFGTDIKNEPVLELLGEE